MSLMRNKLHSELWIFGDKFKRIRKMRECESQQKASELFNVSLDSIKNWEQHYNIPELSMIKKICDTFHCDYDFLLGEQAEPRKEYLNASEYLGISYDSIERISQYPDEIKELLSKLANPKSDSLLFLLQKLYLYGHSRYTSIELKNRLFDNREVFEGKDVENILIYNTSRDIELVLHEVYEFYESECNDNMDKNIELLKLKYQNLMLKQNNLISSNVK